MSSNYAKHYYNKTLEGLSLYFAELNFKINCNIKFSSNEFIRRENKGHCAYNHYIKECTLNFRPSFYTFFDENSCLIKILIPKTYLSIGGPYVNSSHSMSCRFTLLGLEETFLYVTIKKSILDKMSLDFDIAYSKVLNEIQRYCDNQLNKLKNGLIDNENKWIISANYSNVSINETYSY